MRKVVSVLSLVLIICLYLTGCKSEDYKQAVAFQESCDYEAALEIYIALDGYKDSADRIIACNEEITKIEVYNAAVQEYTAAQAVLSDKNVTLDNAIADAESIIADGLPALDPSLIHTLETTISKAKSERKIVPIMPTETDAILALIPEMNGVDYTFELKDLVEAQNAAETSIAQYALVNSPTEAYIISCLEQVSGITGISAATEENDPNGQLHKAGGYTSQVYFSYELVNQNSVSGTSIIEKGTDGGGSIEVYSCVEDAEKRNIYLSTFDGTIFASGSHVVIGTVIVRTSHKLTASQQKALEGNIVAVLTTIES
jgi:hypothetical protein